MKNAMIGLLLLLASTQVPAAQTNACANLVVVELKLHDNGIVPNVPGGAFVHDSVYIGVASDEKAALSNALNACQEAKYSRADCEAAKSTTYAGEDPKYNEAAKTLANCKLM